MFFGLWLILVGVLWLLKELGYIQADLNVVWPVGLIVFGIYLVVKGWQHRKAFRKIWQKIEIQQ